MKIKDVLKKANLLLKNQGYDSYRLDSKLLLCKVLNKDKVYILINDDKEISEKQEEQFFEYINMRSKGKPVKYILEECEFMGLNFKVKEGILIPRPDTEILVENVISIIKKEAYKTVWDVCTGSGAIGLSIAKFTEASVICSDISDICKNVTEKNIELLQLNNKVKYIQSDLLSFGTKNNIKVDLIVSNPPYIKTKEINNLMIDVKEYEPILALDGGEDGLYFYRKIIYEANNILNPNGTIAFEIGYDEREEVSQLLIDNGYKDIRCIKDLASLDRVIIAKK